MDFKATVEKWLDSASEDRLFGTIYVDIDRLMLHNDCFGHAHGDQTIEKVSDTLRAVMPEDCCQFLRVGGDEFIIVVRGEGATAIFELAEKMRMSVERLAIPLLDPDYCAKYPGASSQKFITVSIGAMLMKTLSGSGAFGIGNWVLSSARESVYFAKLAGRNKVVKIDLR